MVPARVSAVASRWGEVLPNSSHDKVLKVGEHSIPRHITVESLLVDGGAWQGGHGQSPDFLDGAERPTILDVTGVLFAALDFLHYFSETRPFLICQLEVH